MNPVAESYSCQFCGTLVGPNDIHWCQKMNDAMRLTEGTKFDQNKIRLELLSPWFVEEVGKVLTSGAHKYEDHNWAKGIKSSRLIGATLRHIFAYMRGEVNDPEWNYHHLAHAACCLMFLIHQDLTGFYEAYDDMPKWEDIPYEE